MEKNIYDLLNEVEIDLNEYETEHFTRLEEKRILKRLISKKETKVIKGNAYKKYVVAASIVVISFGMVGALPTLATMNPAIYKIASMLGLEKNLEDYVTVINQPVNKKGVTVGLGEVMYDQHNHKLMVTTYVTAPEKLTNTQDQTLHQIHERVYINGHLLNTSSRLKVEVMDEYTMGYITSYDIEGELRGPLDMKIWIPQIFVDGEEIRDNWSFEFRTDGENLATDTQVIRLGDEIVLGNGEKLRLVKYTHNILGNSIYYETTDKLLQYLLELRGEDNLGNPVVFRPQGGRTGEGGEFRLAPEVSSLSQEAKTITLKAYALSVPEQDGPITGEYEPVGKEIVIELAQ